MSSKKKFFDRARIFIQAGSGGDGHVSFRREKYLPKGGPDGGDGGRGGHVILVGSQHLTTLQDFHYQRHFRAQSGEPGSKKQMTGAQGEDLVISVPLGTVLYNDDKTQVLCEVLEDGQRVVLFEGGRGGKGNMHFATSVNRAPRKSTPGEKREGKWIRLELRLIADVGIVGPPNAGKSTLLSVLTNAKPKVGDYPFTTISPSLGIMERNDERVTLADIPGLIEGAAEGAGLGFDFLRHIQRTQALVYLSSADPEDLERPLREYLQTRNEIGSYDRSLLNRNHLVVINKIDLLEPALLEKIVRRFQDEKLDPILISAKNKLQLHDLQSAIFSMVRRFDD